MAPEFGQAGPPLLTSDTGTPGPGHWEINVGLTVERSTSRLRLEGPLLDFNYGVGERIQLKYEVPWVTLKEEGGRVKGGIGNSLFGIKYRFLDQDRHGIAMSVYPQFEFNNSSSSADRGLVDKGITFLLPFQVEKQIGKLTVNPELGYLFRQKGDNQWIYGLALFYDLSKNLELVGEVHGTANPNLTKHEPVFNLGFRLKLSQTIALNASAGRSLRHATSDQPILLSYVGLHFTF
jgi:hypothetical protein